MKTYEGVKVWILGSLSECQFHAPAASPLVTNEQDARLDPEPVWMMWRSDNS
jgi:hypothetical protein